MIDLFEYLRNNSYPGRGILAGSFKGERVIAYFIMGRSPNSRNRVFVKDKDVLYTKAFDESKISDPSLIIYNAVRVFEDQTIVTNGDQTDTVYEYLNEGKSFADALSVREYEPDTPNYTPRISALFQKNGCLLSVLKKKEDRCERLFYSYPYEDGKGHFLSTYDHDGDPLPSFSGEPLEIGIDDEFEDFAPKLWDSLNGENKVSLYVSFGLKEKIFNRNLGD